MAFEFNVRVYRECYSKCHYNNRPIFTDDYLSVLKNSPKFFSLSGV